MTITVIHGAPGTGKSLFAEALAKHFGSSRIVDDWSPIGGQRHSLLVSDELVLTQWTPEAIKRYRGPEPWRHPDTTVRFVPIGEAIAALGPDPLVGDAARLLTPAQIEHANALLGTWLGDRALCSLKGAQRNVEDADRAEGALAGKITTRLIETLLIKRGFREIGRFRSGRDGKINAYYLNDAALIRAEALSARDGDRFEMVHPRYRKLVARIANWSDEELGHVDAAQTRMIARRVLDGEDFDYPASIMSGGKR